MNGITMWRVDPVSLRADAFNALVVELQQSCQVEAVRLRSNNGEARADHRSGSRCTNGCRAGRRECRCPSERAAARPFVESAVLRRSRYANRQRWYVVLHGDANRPAGFGAAVFDNSQMCGWQALSRE